MRNENGAIDWERTEEHARSCDSYLLMMMIRDCQDVLVYADERDRQRIADCTRNCVTCYHQSEGGYYRDCISVYRKVLGERRCSSDS